MKRSIHSLMAMAALAAGLGAASGAHAAPSYVGQSGYGAPVYLAQRAPADAYGNDRDRRADRYSCEAPRWDPQVRYMPGQTVWRKGRLYAATGLSASVYNVNSPPEWTPKYWVRVRCR